MPQAVSVSVVVPALDEEKNIGRCIGALSETLEGIGRPCEILVVDDGSRDATAAVSQRTLGSRGRLVSLGVNRGKGAAVRRGILEAAGDYRFFCDADLSVPPAHLPELLLGLEGGVDVAITSRRLPGSRLTKRQPKIRELMGTVYRTLATLLFCRGVSDITCGLKGFRKEAALSIFSRATVDGFGFDTEILYLAKRLRLSIEEFGVEWVDDPDSRVRIGRDTARSFLELCELIVNRIRGRY